jgi:hypothetical protein
MKASKRNWKGSGPLSANRARRKSRSGGTERLVSATAGSQPAPSLNFGEAGEAAPSSLTSHQAVRHAAQLMIMLLDKILSTIETTC